MTATRCGWLFSLDSLLNLEDAGIAIVGQHLAKMFLVALWQPPDAPSSAQQHKSERRCDGNLTKPNQLQPGACAVNEANQRLP